MKNQELISRTLSLPGMTHCRQVRPPCRTVRGN
nr:MAG TPA: hypothetical protein [Caudoviricetes sp.]